MNNLSWLLTTGVNGEDRDPRKALDLAVRATRITQERLPQYLDTLANAYYANGRYGEALSTEQKALSLKPEDKSYQQLFENYQEITKAVANLSASLSQDEPVHPEPGLTPPTPIFTPNPEHATERWYGIV